MEGNAFGELNGKVGHLQGKAKSYQDQVEKYGVDSTQARKKWQEMQQALSQFADKLFEKSDAGVLNKSVVGILSEHVQNLQDVGL